MNTLNIACYIINLFVILLCGVLFAVLPRITRKAFLFGVKIPESGQKHPKATALKKRYLTVITAACAVTFSAATAQFLFWEDLSVIAAIYLPLLLVTAQFAVYIPCWKDAKALKKAENWQVAEIAAVETRSSYSRGRLSSVAWGYYIISFIAILACIVAGLKLYPQLPDKIPTHFDFNMEPDAWKDKSVAEVMLMPLMMFSVLATILITAVISVRAKLQVSPQNPALSLAQHRVYRAGVQHSLGIMQLGITAGFIMLTIPTIMPETKIPAWLVYATLFVPVLPVVIFSMAAGQGGCMLKPAVSGTDSLAAGYQPENTSDVLRKSDDDYWALGMFYHNPNDPALFVEDRFGTGIGFNYSRPAAKIIVLLLLAGTAGAYVWTTTLFLR